MPRRSRACLSFHSTHSQNARAALTGPVPSLPSRQLEPRALGPALAPRRAAKSGPRVREREKESRDHTAGAGRRRRRFFFFLSFFHTLHLPARNGPCHPPVSGAADVLADAERPGVPGVRGVLSGEEAGWRETPRSFFSAALFINPAPLSSLSVTVFLGRPQHAPRRLPGPVGGRPRPGRPDHPGPQTG